MQVLPATSDHLVAWAALRIAPWPWDTVATHAAEDEALYLAGDPARQRGVARALASAVAEWGRANGCTEFASNAMHDDADSHSFHAAIGFAETERVVYFRQRL